MNQVRQLGDALKHLLQVVPQGPNLACPRTHLTRRPLPFTLVVPRGIPYPQQSRCTVAEGEGLRPSALASARIRSGPRTWEIDRLYLEDDGPPTDISYPPTDQPEHPREPGRRYLPQVLENLTQGVGSQGAEKLMLRVTAGSDLITEARHCGFFPYFEEILLQGSGSSGHSQVDPGLSLRVWDKQDEYAMFQVYCAATPSPVRAGLGMTFDQWKDTREKPKGGCQASVYEKNGKLRGWLSATEKNRSHLWDLIIHPDEGDAVARLVEHTMACRGTHHWLVPDYQGAVINLLENLGFQEAGRYTMLIKSTTAKIGRTVYSSAEAVVW